MSISQTSGPKFIMAAGSSGALQLMPPFRFQGVTIRCFPLRSSVVKQAELVQSYLNVIPPEVGYFRPFLPYVYLLIINYGKMAVEAANMGWIAQNEIAFSIALEWYKKDKNGKLQFFDFAYVSPFIYVDNDLSMTTGREVYGWPKGLISITPETTSWMENPRKAPRLATVSAMVYPALYEGAKQELLPMLQIEQTPAPSLTQVPPDLGSNIFPWISIPNAIRGSAALLGDMGALLNGFGLTRHQTGATPESFAEMGKLCAKNFNPWNPNIYFNTVNLKQFRDSEIPGAFCYQGVTNAKMKLSKFNQGGMLGDLNMALGDSTGGYRILLHKWPTQPVVDSLGIEVARSWNGKNCEVAELRPVCPMWLDVDMEYGKGETLAWRTRGEAPNLESRAWHILPGHEDPASPAKPETKPSTIPGMPHDHCRFNTTLGTSLDLTGPFDFPNTTIRVLPLLADRSTLQNFLEGFLNKELHSAGQYFEAWGRYVYLVATSYEETASESNNVGDWADNDVVFYVPVKWYDLVKEGDTEKKVLRTVALVPVFAFADGTTVAVTRSEVTGIPTQKAEITSPPDAWMDDAGPSDGALHKLLSVSAQLLPVVGMGQPTSNRKLIEISEHEDVRAFDDVVGWRVIAEKWGKLIVDELRRKREMHRDHPAEITTAKALGAAVLTGQLPIRLVTLKQFRDGGSPDEACYQSLAEIDRTIQRVYDLREIDERIIVRIHRYSSRPIVQSLGLLPKATDYVGATPVDSFQAVRPFWMKVSLHEKLGRRILWRAGDKKWEHRPKDPEQKSVFSREPGARMAVDTGPKLVERIERSRPQRLRDHVSEWKKDLQAWNDRLERAAQTQGPEEVARLASSPEAVKPTSLEEALTTIETIGPQIALESILSNEWENWGNPHWYKAYVEILRLLKEAVMGYARKDIAQQELAFAQETIGKLGDFFPLGRNDVVPKLMTMLDTGSLVYGVLDHAEKCAEQLDDLHKETNITEAERSTRLEAIITQFGKEWAKVESLFDSQAGSLDVGKIRNPNGFAPYIQLARSRWKSGKEEIVVFASKAAQPPDTFVRRDSLGTESNRRLSADNGVGPDRIWYVGPQIPSATSNLRSEEEYERDDATTQSFFDEEVGRASPVYPAATPAPAAPPPPSAAKGSPAKNTRRASRAKSKSKAG